jgi:AcrR family transcriptional regulator
LDAAAALIAKGGIGAVTMEAVARAAGVGKPTVYRNWESREALAMAALLKGGQLRTSVKGTDSALNDLGRQLSRVAKAFCAPRGRNAALMVASAEPDSELGKAFRNQVMLASREEGRALLDRAAAEGSIRGDADFDVILDLIYGPIFYRLLMGHAPVSESFVEALLTEVLKGLGPCRA